MSALADLTDQAAGRSVALLRANSVAEGYLVSRSGGYTQVAHGSATDSVAVPRDRMSDPSLRIDFRYGRPDVSQFPRAAWLRSTRRVLNEVPSDRLVYLDGGGAPLALQIGQLLLQLDEELALDLPRGHVSRVGAGCGSVSLYLVERLRSRVIPEMARPSLHVCHCATTGRDWDSASRHAGPGTSRMWRSGEKKTHSAAR